MSFTRLAGSPALRVASSALRKPCRNTAYAAPRTALAARLFSSSVARFDVMTRYTPKHEWVTYDTASNIGTIGITEHAQKALGDVVYVELPSEGSEVKEGEEIGAVESVKAASDIYSPVTGTVTAVNDRLSDEATLLNKSAEKDGWLCQIRLANPSELEGLLEKEAYEKLTEEEAH